MTPQQIARMLMQAEEFERLSHPFYAPVYVIGRDLASHIRRLSDEVLRLRRENAALLERELAEIDAEPLTEAQVDRIARAATMPRTCDGCGEVGPFDPELWLVLDGDGCLWNFCPACRRRRRSRSPEPQESPRCN